MTRTLNVRTDDCSGAVLCDRTTPYGNRFVVGRDGDRLEVIAKHAVWLFRSGFYKVVARELRDCDLACHCAPLPCHCDTLRLVAATGTYPKEYAGIGNRFGVPDSELAFVERLAAYLARIGFTCRSGGAVGTDTAFERGATDVGQRLLEKFSANGVRRSPLRDELMEVSARHHPDWEACDDYVRLLHARNAQIVLGKTMVLPVRFVLCWAADPSKGGTSQALRLADHYGIKWVNLRDAGARYLFEKRMEKAR